MENPSTELLKPRFAVELESLNAALAVVNRWEFSHSATKLADPDYCGWDVKRIAEAEVDYKRFLALAKAAPDSPIVPSKDIDRFWHEHILDTRRYVKDCHELFGEFFHHNPFFGMNGREDESEWKAAAQESSDIWRSVFEADLYRIPSIGSLAAIVVHCRSHCIPTADALARRPHCRSHCIP